MITALNSRAEIALDNFALDPYCKLYLPLYKLDGDSFMSKDAYGHLCTRYDTATPPAAHWTPQGWVFDGVDDYIDCGNDASLNITDAITLEAWVKPPDVGGYRVIVAKHYKWVLRLEPNGRLLSVITTGGFAAPELSGVTVVDDNSWHHVVMTYKSGDWRLYCDGELDAARYDRTGSLDLTGSPVTIGNIGANWYEGLIALALIYSRVLTPQEASYHYIVGKELFG